MLLVCLFVVFAEAAFVEFKASELQGSGVKLSLKDGYLMIEELPEDESFEYLTAVFYKGSGYKSVKSKSNENTNSVEFKIPYYSDDNYEVAIFNGNDILTPFLPYTIMINIDDGKTTFVKSPTYKSNLSKYQSSPSDKTDMEYYSFYYLSEQEGDEQVRNIVKSLISGKDNNYEKTYSIYNWLAENFYYDSVLKDKNTTTPKTMKQLLVDKVCDSYEFSSLFSFMLRASGIPCRTVFGIALVNNKDALQPTVHHYWNEVYVDGTWMIVDVSMACSNRFLDGNKIRSPKTSDIYFDSTMEFFSYSHNIISYEEPAYYEGYEKPMVVAKKNGTKKDADSLGLPKTVTVNTSIGDLILEAKWNLENCNYDPNDKGSQTFTVNGYVTLPSTFAACNSLKQNISVSVTVNERVPVKAELVSLPNNLAFFQNSEIDPTGLELKVTFDNGDVEPVKRTYTLEYDFSEVGKASVKAKYKSVDVSFEVDVVSKTPNEILVEKKPNKTVYFLNENFDSNGLKLVALCDKGMSYEITDFTSEYDFSVQGNREVLLTYKGFSAIITVLVEQAKPTDIKLLTLPKELIIYRDSSIDLSNVTAEITYNDGSVKIVSNELVFDYDLSKVGKSNVVVKYADLSTSFEIEVLERQDNSSSSGNDNSFVNNDESVNDVSDNTIGNTDNKDNKDNKDNNKSIVIEIVAVSIISILLIVLAFFTILRSNEIHNISEWIKNKR